MLRMIMRQQVQQAKAIKINQDIMFNILFAIQTTYTN
jgi:hypothetical protein